MDFLAIPRVTGWGWLRPHPTLLRNTVPLPANGTRIFRPAGGGYRPRERVRSLETPPAFRSPRLRGEGARRRMRGAFFLLALALMKSEGRLAAPFPSPFALS